MARKALNQLTSFAGAAAICLLITLSPGKTHAGLGDELDGLFNSMSNSTSTSPGAYKSSRRGVFYGGSYTMKSKIVDPTLFSFRPPSWKGGCGGVDMFGGSFSFINADQFVQMIRAIAANAKGYAFQLAMDAVCPDCMVQLQSLSDTMNELNKFLGNSCQMAQTAVDKVDGLFGVSNKLRQASEEVGSVVGGIVPDFLQAKQEQTGESATEAARRIDTPLLEADRGNIMWNIIEDQNLPNWFASGDDQLMRTIMSLTGTVIVGDLGDSIDQTGSQSPQTDHIPGAAFKLMDLVDGNKVEIYRCEGTGCTSVDIENKEEITLTSLEAKIVTGANKLILAYTNNTAIDDTDSDIALVRSLGETATIIHKMSSLSSTDSARKLIIDYSKGIALYASYMVIEDMFYAALQAAMMSKTSYKDDIIKMIKENRQKISDDYQTARTKIPDMKDLMTHYNAMIINIRKQRRALNIAQSGKK